MTKQATPAHRKPERHGGPKDRESDEDDTLTDFIEAREDKIFSKKGRIYGSNPVPVIITQNPCKKGGDHIRDGKSMINSLIY